MGGGMGGVMGGNMDGGMGSGMCGGMAGGMGSGLGEGGAMVLVADGFQGGVDPRSGVDFGNPGDRYAGTIKSYSLGVEKGGGGYGFIECAALDGDCWFSKTELPPVVQTLPTRRVIGTTVTFSLRPSREGKRQAKIIRTGDLGGAAKVPARGGSGGAGSDSMGGSMGGGMGGAMGSGMGGG